jgi:hypothetical protein
MLVRNHCYIKTSGLGEKADEPNNLLSFMRMIARKTKNLILGTATPIQTNVGELWDLLSTVAEACLPQLIHSFLMLLMCAVGNKESQVYFKYEKISFPFQVPTSAKVRVRSSIRVV